MQWIHLIATGGNSLGVIFSVCNAQRKPPKITVFHVSSFFFYFFLGGGEGGLDRGTTFKDFTLGHITLSCSYTSLTAS